MMQQIIQNEVDKQQYEEDLKYKREQHLEAVKRHKSMQDVFKGSSINEIPNTTWKPCLHDLCSSCFGTGIKVDGTSCIHYLSCTCPKCQPTYYYQTNL
jgi:hypothetical protein